MTAALAKDRHATGVAVAQERGRVRVGPSLGDGACATCLSHRRARASLTGRPAEPVVDSPLVTAAARAVVEELVGRVEARPRRGPGWTYWLLDPVTLEVEEQRFLADPACPKCGGLPADGSGDLAPEHRPWPKTPGAQQHRVRDLDEELDQLSATVVGRDAGLIRSLNSSTIGRVVVAGAPLRLRGLHEFEPGFGRADTFRTSRLTALLEGLERYAGSSPGRRRTSVRASYAEVAHDAVDPRSLGLPRETGAGTRYRTFTEDAPTSWVWGWSLTERRARLVPEEVAYFAVPSADRADPPFCDEVGSGGALGGCWEEAALHGLWELIERDGFLLTWLTRMSIPRLTVASLEDRPLALHAAALSAETGFEVHLFDSTMEHGIPSVWAVATGPDPSVGPTLICGGGAAATRARAARRAVLELAPMVHVIRDHFAPHAERAADMAGDPRLVGSMMDHYLVNASPAARGRLDFLLATPPSAPLPDPVGLDGPDLTQDLHEAVRMLAEHDLEVIVVDQTPPEVAALGLSAVKVVVPGLVPLAFGHARARWTGLDRVLEVPVRLGHAPRPLTVEELNGHPHPFP